jgi:hypothetical protein
MLMLMNVAICHGCKHSLWVGKTKKVCALGGDGTPLAHPDLDGVKIHLRAENPETCPPGFLSVDGNAPSHPAPPAASFDWAVEGPKLWATIFNAQSAEEILAINLPCGECKGHWTESLKSFPPPSDAAMIPQWTLDRRNEVSRRIGKPEITMAEAADRWGADSKQPPAHHD